MCSSTHNVASIRHQPALPGRLAAFQHGQSTDSAPRERALAPSSLFLLCSHFPPLLPGPPRQPSGSRPGSSCPAARPTERPGCAPPLSTRSCASSTSLADVSRRRLLRRDGADSSPNRPSPLSIWSAQRPDGGPRPGIGTARAIAVDWQHIARYVHARATRRRQRGTGTNAVAWRRLLLLAHQPVVASPVADKALARHGPRQPLFLARRAPGSCLHVSLSGALRQLPFLPSTALPGE